MTTARNDDRRPQQLSLKARRTAATVVVAGALSACANLLPHHGAAPPPSRPQAEAPPAPPAATPTAPAAPKRQAVRPKPPAATPEQSAPIVVVGLSRPEVMRTLGAPVERADHPPGQSWVYRAGACTLEVLFLFDVGRNDMFAIDRKLAGTDGSARAEQQCLQRIKAANGSTS